MKKPNPYLFIDFIHSQKNSKYKIEGYFVGENIKPTNLQLRVGEKSVVLNFIDRKLKNDEPTQLGDILKKAFVASFVADSDQKQTIRPTIKGRQINVKTGFHSGLSNLALSYKKHDNHIWVKFRKTLVLHPLSKERLIFFELLTQLSILSNLKIIESYKKFIQANGARGKLRRIVIGAAAILESLITIPYAIILRWAYFMRKRKKNKPIWIISDRAAAAGDNGEVLFDFISKQNDLPARVYFAIAKDSADYDHVSKLGEVLSYGSFKYKLNFLLADKIVSSHADNEVTNPFFRQVDRYLDLFNFNFVFLQHGIIRHDLSDWLNRFEKNISLFITSSDQERNRILSLPYYYSNEQVVVTGLPRYDRLENRPKRKIIIAPTYRKFLLKKSTDKMGERPYDAAFKESEYFHFYNKLINDTKIQKAMNDHDVAGEFYLHPVFKSQTVDFQSSEAFRVMDYPYDYKTAISTGSLLISDHSSIVFDFAYLRKPVLYAHFDAEAFYKGHSFSRPEAFDERNEGFGKVCTDYQLLVEEIIQSIKSDFHMPKEYERRAEKFFEHNDQNNSQRVYEEIISVDKGVK